MKPRGPWAFALYAGTALAALPATANAQSKPSSDEGEIVPPLPRNGASPAATATPAKPATTGPVVKTTEYDVIVPPLPRPKPEAAEPEPEAVNDGSDKKKSGRIFELVWADAEAGFAYVNLASVSSKNLEVAHASSSGGMFGFGAGIRILAITLGATARLDELSTFNFWEVDGQLGIHIPIQRWDPYFGFHGGYAFVGDLGQLTSMNQITIHGVNAGANIGVDYYVLPYLSFGGDLTGDFLFLGRPPLAIPADVPPAEKKKIEEMPDYKESGDSIGLGLAISVHLGVHI